jgi:hypothetical protein
MREVNLTLKEIAIIKEALNVFYEECQKANKLFGTPKSKINLKPLERLRRKFEIEIEKEGKP